VRLHILVEGPSEVAFLNAWLPRFLPAGHSYRLIPHQGKGRLPGDSAARVNPKRRGLLDQLPAKLRAYGNTLQADTDRVVILVDVDDDDCEELLGRIKKLIDQIDPAPVALVRLAIEETEAFYLGDFKGIKSAYPGARWSRLRDHSYDSICETWELFQQVINAEFEDKVEWAERIGLHLGIRYKGARANKSPSFRKFCEGLMRLCGESN
jgi:hypothetical protein